MVAWPGRTQHPGNKEGGGRLQGAEPCVRLTSVRYRCVTCADEDNWTLDVRARRAWAGSTGVGVLRAEVR